MDDIFISAATIQEHGEKLKEVFKRLSTAQLTVNKDKCQFIVKDVDFLGYRVTKNGTTPPAEKVKAIQETPKPNNKQKLQAFLGFINFYNRFLKNKASVAEKIHRLLNDNAVHIDIDSTTASSFSST